MNIDKKARHKNSLKSYYLPFIILFIITFSISCRGILHPGDDLIYRDAFRIYGGVRGWVESYTEIWSGRIIPHFLLIVLINKNLILWKVANSVIFVILALGIFNMAINTEAKISDNKKSIIATIICGMIFFIPIPVMSSGAIWITGSFNYLWAIAFGIIALIPFKRLITGEKVSKIMISYSAISAIYASYAEQSVAVMLAFSGITLVYCIFAKVKCKIYHYFMFILIGINAFISLSAPGNKVRATAETLRFYSDFDMLSFIDKLFLGVNVTFSHIFKASNLLMLILSILILLLVSKKTEDKITITMATIPFIYTSLKFLSIEKLFNFGRTNEVYIGGIVQYASVFSAIVVCLICLYMFFVIFDKFQNSIISGMFFSGALCSAVVMGISPTVYASGSRVFFITDILIILCIVNLFSFYMEKYYKKSNSNTAMLIGFIGISLITALNYIINIAPNMYL